MKPNEIELINQIKTQFEPEEIIQESGLSRIYLWAKTKEIVGITAWRDTLINTTDKTLMDIWPGEPYTKEQLRTRNTALKSRLLKLGYGVTDVIGSYTEEKVNSETVEESFIVVNLNNDPKFYLNLFRLSEYFNQDCFLYKAPDFINAYLIGTNHATYPGYRKLVNVGPFHTSVTNKLMSRIKNASFAFTTDPDKEYKKSSFKERKNKRSNLSEIERSLGFETFDTLSLSAKFLCDSYHNSFNLIE